MASFLGIHDIIGVKIPNPWVKLVPSRVQNYLCESQNFCESEVVRPIFGPVGVYLGSVVDKVSLVIPK